MIKNIKIQVKSDEENQYVLNKLLDMNKEFAWYVGLYYGRGYYDAQNLGNRAVCSVWKGFRHLVIDKDGDLILCVFEKYYKRRTEKEVTFEEFKQMVEPKKTLWDKRGIYQGDSLRTVDVKDALKEYVNYARGLYEIHDGETALLHKAKEIFGTELLEKEK